MKKHFSFLLFLLLGLPVVAQTTISGEVVESGSSIPIPSANISVVGSNKGAVSDFNGKFTIEVSKAPPFTLRASRVGYATISIKVENSNQVIKFSLKEGTELDEVVVSASRTPERIFESPVTVERMDIRAIQNTASPTYYDALENMKGVDVNTNSLTFKSVNTRGFAAFSNTRFMQLVDGMDNSSPALNFPIGNLLGMSELDVKNVELLPGASSALYGANAFNGILFMTSKNAFESPGVSAYVKSGVTSQKSEGNNQFVDAGVRVAKVFSDKFAAKVSFSFLKGTDWGATDYRNYADGAQGGPDVITEVADNAISFDRINVYGDEVKTNINDVAKSLIALGGLPVGSDALVPSVDVSRTGYKESDLTDYEAKNFKADIGLYYRPNENIEISYVGKVGTGNTIYQGANRYYLKNFLIQQHKLEVTGENFFWRGYMTAEDAGDSYDMFFTGVNLNRQTAQNWFGTYVGAFVQAKGASAPDNVAHAGARQAADATITLQPGTDAFQQALDGVIADSDILSGSKFVDKSKIYHSDFNYNFKDKIEFAEIQIGASIRRYSLNSGGTIFTDKDGAINYDEYGVYSQLQKKMLEERLKFTGSIRYDKAQNFDGFISPRASLVYALDEDKKHNLRLSCQTGFRNPTTQDQYIGLDVSRAILVGSAPDNLDRYTSRPLSVSATGQLFGQPATVQLSGREAYDNSFVAASVLAGAPVKSNIEFVKPEKVTAYEFGYRGLINKVTIDFSAYYNNYEDFIGGKTVLVPLYGKADFSDGTFPVPGVGDTPKALVALSSGDFQPFQTYTNSAADVSSYGAAVGLTTKVGNGYELGMNYTWAKFDFNQASDPDYEAGFNTPEHKFKASFGNRAIAKNIGFKVDVRWSDSYLWESTFVDGILPARTTLDAQVSFKVPSLRSSIKVGGANLGGQEYFSAPGTGAVGSQYYVSWTTGL